MNYYVYLLCTPRVKANSVGASFWPCGTIRVREIWGKKIENETWISSIFMRRFAYKSLSLFRRTPWAHVLALVDFHFLVFVVEVTCRMLGVIFKSQRPCCEQSTDPLKRVSSPILLTAESRRFPFCCACITDSFNSSYTVEIRYSPLFNGTF